MSDDEDKNLTDKDWKDIREFDKISNEREQGKERTIENFRENLEREPSDKLKRFLDEAKKKLTVKDMKHYKNNPKPFDDEDKGKGR